MKKNYICRLKQYDAKTSLKDKQNLYTRKFIKTCYSAINKQNEDPNASNKKNQSFAKENHRKIKSEQLQQTKTSDQKESTLQNATTDHRSISHFREININPYECELNSHHCSNVLYVADDNTRKVICCEQCSMKYLNKTLFFDKELSAGQTISEEKRLILTNIRLECVKLERLLKQKQAQQIQKCNKYYEVLCNELKNQQKHTINSISSAFQRSNQLIINKLIQIESLINETDEDYHEDVDSQRFCSFFHPKDTTIEIDIATININDHILQRAKTQMCKFDLQNLGFISDSPPKQNHSQNPDRHALTRNGKSNEESLACSEELVDPYTTQTIKNQLDISFEQNQDFIIGGDYPLIEDTQQQQCNISPSFKYF